MSDALARITGGDDRVRADLDTAEVPVTLGQPATIDVEVTNVDEVIRSYRVDVLGLDAAWVSVDIPELDLFPGERRRVQLTVLLPDTYPSGRRRIAVEVTEPGVDDASTIAIELDLVLDPSDSVVLTVEPATLETGRFGTFVLTPTNTGNTTLDLRFAGQDPERVVDISFDPDRVRLVPGETAVIEATATGERPWFGMPLVRMLELTATGGDASAVSTVAMLQRARIPRRVLTIAGLVLAVTVFAFVIMLSFANVADLAAANADLLKQGLGEDQPVGGRVDPVVISGQVTSTTGGGIDGVAVELYDQANPIVPAVATVTDTAGRYRFSGVPDGTYVMRVAVAGFGEVWYPTGETVADAEPFEVEPGLQFPDRDVQLAGQPGVVAGVVRGVEVAGALVEARLPADAIEGSDLPPLAATVAAFEVDATGEYSLGDLPTPATYQIAVELPGFATEVRTIALRPGEERGGVDVLLRRGDGRIAGQVVDTAGTPLPGVVVAATDGETETGTRTLSGEAVGTFELRDLPTPGTYTLSFAAEGFFPATVTLNLDAEQQLEDVQVVMTSAQGSLAGTVRAPDGTPLGGVDIAVVGGDVERTTVSLSNGEVGAWTVTGLPVPSSYTVTFRRPGRITQALSVELSTGPQADRTGVDAVLGRATSSVAGTVVDPSGTPLSGVAVELASTDVTRQTITADRPSGTFGFESLPPGAYTLTFRRVGSTPQTLLVDLAAGEDRRLAPVELEQQARITGVVRRQGVGEAGIGVVAYRFDDFPTEVALSTISGAGGSFELVGLDAPETYLIEFQVPAGGPVVGSRTVFILPGETVDLQVNLE